MTSAKKYGIQEFTTKLPDFLLQFIDANIRNDTYGALRKTHLSHKIDDLISEHLQQPEVIWLFVDPSGTDHIFINNDQFAVLSKASESLPKKDKQLQVTTTQSYYSLQFEPKNIVASILKQEQLLNLSKIKMVTLDQIRLKCEANLYFEPEEIIKDITNVIAWNQVYRAFSKRTFIHLWNFYGKFLQLITKRKFISKFYEKKNKDFQELGKLQLQFKVQLQCSWPIIPKKFRQYEPLQKYVPTPQNRTQIIQARLKSQKKPVECPKNCVCYRQNLKDNSEFCNYSLADVWQTSCPNRRAKIQCNHQDEARAANCRNSQIKNKQRKKVKQASSDQNCQIEEFMAWGMDLFTRNCIYNCLPEIDIIDFCQFQRNTQNKNSFIQNSLQKSLNFLGESGYNVIQACKFIIQKGPTIEDSNNIQNKKRIWRAKHAKKQNNISQSELFTISDVLYATNLLQNKKYADQQWPANQLFRIHTKGKGAKCIAKQGIKRGTFIVEYFGEIYQPWRWYERQDFIKEVLKKKRLKDQIPQFYNIYLQKHNDEPLGYDILVVDPIKKGNFSSRFSHSCNPNCGTVSTVSDGKYVIGMYSIRDIVYGEQFTFDYCSMTESNYQHTHSICLCGSKQCRGYYLQLSNSKIYNNLMDSNSCFHYRNSLMLQSLGSKTQEQMKICSQNSIETIEGGILYSLPDWIVKWCSIILQSIKSQGKIYRQQLKESWLKQYPWECKDQAQQEKLKKIELYSSISQSDLVNLRRQNLFTTIDKIKYYLQSIQDPQPPLFYQNKSKVCDILIENQSKDSILILLQDECMNEKLKEESQLIETFIKKITLINQDLQERKKQGFTQDMLNQFHQKKLFYFRLCCLCVSHQILCKANGSINNRLLLSDIIYFYSFTHTFFAPHQYKTHTSEQIKVTLQEIIGESCNSKFSDKTRKRYTSPCVWGQMVSWFKQTIVNPEASLSQDRRGTLSYPLINSILKSTYPFQKHARNSFLKTLRQKPASSWPPASGCQLSYKNPYKCYGTMLFQNVHNKKAFEQLPKRNLLDSVLDLINCSLKDKLTLFKQVETIIQKIPENSQLYDILEKLNLNFDQIPNIQTIKVPSKGAPRKRVKRQQKQISQSDQRSQKSIRRNKSKSISENQNVNEQNYQEP